MANAITCVRIICALNLILCPSFSVRFYTFYIVGGISDIFDGIVARNTGKETKFGAQFDTVADIIFAAVVILKTVQTVNIPLWLIIWIAGIAAIKFTNILGGFFIYKRFVCEHTFMNKICGVVLFAIVFCIGQFSHRAEVMLIILTCSVATFAAVQEGYYIYTGKEID